MQKIKKKSSIPSWYYERRYVTPQDNTRVEKISNIPSINKDAQELNRWLNGYSYRIETDKFGIPTGVIMNDGERVPDKFINDVLERHSKLYDSWNELLKNRPTSKNTIFTQGEDTKHSNKERERFSKGEKSLREQKQANEFLDRILSLTAPSTYTNYLTTKLDLPDKDRQDIGIIADIAPIFASGASGMVDRLTKNVLRRYAPKLKNINHITISDLEKLNPNDPEIKLLKKYTPPKLQRVSFEFQDDIARLNPYVTQQEEIDQAVNQFINGNTKYLDDLYPTLDTEGQKYLSEYFKSDENLRRHYVSNPIHRVSNESSEIIHNVENAKNDFVKNNSPYFNPPMPKPSSVPLKEYEKRYAQLMLKQKLTPKEQSDLEFIISRLKERKSKFIPEPKPEVVIPKMVEPETTIATEEVKPIYITNSKGETKDIINDITDITKNDNGIYTVTSVNGNTYRVNPNTNELLPNQPALQGIVDSNDFTSPVNKHGRPIYNINDDLSLSINQKQLPWWARLYESIETPANKFLWFKSKEIPKERIGNIRLNDNTITGSFPEGSKIYFSAKKLVPELTPVLGGIGYGVYKYFHNPTSQEIRERETKKGSMKPVFVDGFDRDLYLYNADLGNGKVEKLLLDKKPNEGGYYNAYPILEEEDGVYRAKNINSPIILENKDGVYKLIDTQDHNSNNQSLPADTVPSQLQDNTLVSQVLRFFRNNNKYVV